MSRSTLFDGTASALFEALAGAAGGRFSGDVIMPLAGRDLCLEVKARADGFRNLYDWLQDRDVLIVKADRQEPLGCRFGGTDRQRDEAVTQGATEKPAGEILPYVWKPPFKTCPTR